MREDISDLRIYVAVTYPYPRDRNATGFFSNPTQNPLYYSSFLLFCETTAAATAVAAAAPHTARPEGRRRRPALRCCHAAITLAPHRLLGPKERERESREGDKTWLLMKGFFFLFYQKFVLQHQTQFQNSGCSVKLPHPWIWHGSSISLRKKKGHRRGSKIPIFSLKSHQKSLLHFKFKSKILAKVASFWQKQVKGIEWQQEFMFQGLKECIDSRKWMGKLITSKCKTVREWETKKEAQRVWKKDP